MHKQMRTRVKICGITRAQDAEFAAKNGADAIGLVFYPASPRAVDIAQASQVIAQLPPFVSVVALFVNASAEQVKAVMDALPVDLLQFHGDESAEYCEQFDYPYIKAIRMRETTDLLAQVEQYQSASGLLLDSYEPGKPGGTGKAFDWSLITKVDKPIILAGGLNESNVSDAIRQVQPYAVDVSGGVEAEKGIKDSKKISAFMREVADA